MMVTIVNVATCVIGLTVGLYTLTRHLNIFNHARTRLSDAWLVSLGSMAWSIALFHTLVQIYEYQSWQAWEIGMTGAETFARVLFGVYWCGVLLQVQKHCLKIKLRKRKVEHTE